MISIARASMTMRANLQRDIAPADSYGGKAVTPVWSIIAAEAPCFVWISQKKEVADGGKIVVVEEIRGIFPADVDIRSGDRVFSLQDRRGQTVVEQQLDVEAVSERSRGPKIDHKSVLLRRHRA